jgi:amino acid transporter
MHATEMLVAILIPLSFFLLIFGIIYMQKRENLAMIEKGLNPKEFANRPAPYKNLKWGFLLIGAGAGLFVAYILDNYILSTSRFDHDGNVPIYFALIAIGGGLGLYGSYKVEKKWWDENKLDRP